MAKKLKTKEQLRADDVFASKAIAAMKKALREFYGEYSDWECNYSRIGLKYYEAMHDAFERLEFSIKRANQKYVSSGGQIDWKTTTHECHYKELASNAD